MNKIHIKNLDGLRGIAILMVVLYHYFGNDQFLTFGWSGVSLFFIISGFLITKNLLAYPVLNSKTLKEYAVKRIARIYPTYIILLIVFFSILIFVTQPVNQQKFSFYFENWLYFIFQFQNILMIQTGVIRENHLGHLWSLAVECQFYILAPLIIILSQHKNRIYFFLLIFLSALSLRIIQFATHPEWKFYFHYLANTFARIDDFLLGCIVFLYHKKWPNTIAWVLAFSSLLLLGLIYIHYDSFYFHNSLMCSIGFTAFGVLYSSITLFALSGSAVSSYIFSNRILLFFGKISYSLYLIHWPFLRFFALKIRNILIEVGLENTTRAYTISLTISLSISIILSYVSFVYIESYFINKANNFYKRP